MGSENKNGKVPLISKIAYGFGDVVWAFTHIVGISALILYDPSGSLKCKNTLCDPVKEIPVMGYRDDYSVIAIQIIL